MTEPHGARSPQLRMTPMSVPAYDPKITPISTRVIPATVPARGRRRPGWTLLLVPPTVNGSVRTFDVRPWQIKVVAGSIVAMLAAVFLGGAFISMRFGSEEDALISAKLVEAEHQLDAIGDTLRALQIMATLSPVTPGPISAPATKSGRRSSVAWEPPRPAAGVILPVDGRISSVFSLRRRHPILRIRRPHHGVDIVAPTGTEVTVPAAGRVSSVERNFSFGLVVEIEHANGVTTRYAHLRSALVSVGDQVTPGKAIATVGSTGLSSGPHLHYEVEVSGRTVNPLRYLFKATVVEPVTIPIIPSTSDDQDSTVEEGPGM